MGATRALLVVLFAGSVGAWSRGVNAEILEFTDPAEWEAAVGTFATIDFTDFPEFTIITTQYQDLGVTFTDGDDFTNFNPSAFLNDSWGLFGGLGGVIGLSFETPQRWIAVDFPGALRMLLFNDGRLIDFTSIFSAGPDGVGGFGGIVSTEPFDAAILTDPGDDFVFIDDLHFGKCASDLNGDGVVNVLDLIDLLLCFGQPAVPGCEAADVNGDGTVNVLDLIELLLDFGETCP